MGRGSVKRFNAKTARTFKLVPRSIIDGGEDGEERVFVEVTPGVSTRLALDNIMDAFIDVESVGSDDHLSGEEDMDMDMESEIGGKHPGEAAKFGILYDDRMYDYTKHLKTVGEVPGGVFIAAPGASDSVPDLDEFRFDPNLHKDLKTIVTDPDVLECLIALEDDAYNVDEEDDSFVMKMDVEEFDDNDDDDYIVVDDDEAELKRVLGELEYSSEGDSVSEQPKTDLKDYEKIKACIKEDNDDIIKEKKNGFAEMDEIRKALLGECPLVIPSEPSDFDSDEYFEQLEEKKHADTILDSQDRLGLLDTSNKPKMILLSKRTGMPIRKSTDFERLESTDNVDNHNETRENMGAPRSKEESAEEKKARKAAVKQLRRERRQEKKEHRVMFA